PPLPLDGGVLTVGATSTLALNGTNDFSPGAGGRGGEVDISAGNILIIADDLKDNLPTAAQNYLVLTAGQVNKLFVPDPTDPNSLGAARVLIGGTASFDSNGELITATATNLEVLTDPAYPLSVVTRKSNPVSGLELMLVTRAGGNGLTI